MARAIPSFYWDAMGTGIVIDPENVPNIVSNTVFYVKLTYAVTGCESPLASFRVIVKEQPDVEVQDIYACSGDNVDLTSAIVSQTQGSTIEYYRDFAGTMPVLTPTEVNITSITPFFVKAVNETTTCESEMKNFIVMATVPPTITVQDINTCMGGDVDLSTAVTHFEGNSVQYYSDMNGQIPISQTVNNVTGVVTYYARSIADIGCQSALSSFVVTPNPIPDVTIGNMVYCSGENVPEYNFSGTVSGATYEWQRLVGHDFGLTQTFGIDIIPAFTAQNTGVYPLEAVYEVTPVYTANGVRCTGTPQYSLMTVNPVPTLAPVTDMVHCYGTEVPPYIFTSDVADADYKWQRTGGSPIPFIPESGEDVIPAFMAKANGSAVTANYKVTADFSFANRTCNNGDTINFSITLLPQITVSITDGDQTICSGETMNDIVFGSNVPLNNVTFNWNRVSGYVPGLPVSGTGSIASQVFTNTGSEAVTALYQVVPTYNYNNLECEGIPSTFSVTVMPEIQLNTIPDFVFCAGMEVPVYEFDNNPAIRYTWVNEDNINVGLPDSGTGPLPAFTTVNSSTMPVTTHYRVTAHETVNNVECTNEVLISITVNPALVVNPVVSQELCNNSPLDIIFTGDGTSYQWERISGSNVGIPLQGTGNMAGLTVVNNTTAPITATYKVAPLLGTCTGPEQIFDITVLPTPELSSSLNAGTVCSGATFEYDAQSNTLGVVYTWNRAANPFINGGLVRTGNTARISETLINTSDAPVTVNYEYSLTTGTCPATTEIVSIVVNPTPKMDINYTSQLCVGVAEVEIPYTTTVTVPMEYKIIFSDAAIAQGFQNQVNFTALPAGQISIPVPANVANGYYAGVITLQLGDCTEDFAFELSAMNPFSIIEQPHSVSNLCNGDSDFELSVSASEEHLSYQWFHNGSSIAGATSNTYTAGFDTSTAGEYYVEITSVCQTLISDTVQVQENPVSIAQEWENVIYVQDYDHHYARFQWYKNGSPVTTNGFAQYYGEEQGLDGTYYARCYYADGSYVETCPVSFTRASRTSTVLYPNPAAPRASVYVDIDSNEIDPTGAQIIIYDLAGKMIDNLPAQGTSTEIKAPVAKGNYVVRITTKNKHIVQRLIVK